MDNNMTFLNACRNGQKGIVLIFLKKGGIDVNKRDAEGNTPLHYACLKGYRDIVNLLLDSEADATIANNLSETPLHAASRSGNKEIIGKLLQYGADIDATDSDGRTPLIRLLDNRRTDHGAQGDRLRHCTRIAYSGGTSVRRKHDRYTWQHTASSGGFQRPVGNRPLATFCIPRHDRYGERRRGNPVNHRLHERKPCRCQASDRCRS